LANRQSPIDNPGYPVFSLPTFSLSNRTKKVRAPVQSPPKSQVFGPPLGIFSPFASPRLASFLPIASGWSVTCLPHFSPTELPRLETKPQRSPLTRPFFFSRPFLPSSSARLTSHPTDKANSPLRHNGRHRQATHCRPGCCLPAHEAKELRCQRAWCHCRLLHRLHCRCWSVWSPRPQVDSEEKSCHQVSDLDDILRLGEEGVGL
ncbi:hypothetical protein M441DRAFT_40298, partial [Trichoderma asperellum CBS 433.97]